MPMYRSKPEEWRQAVEETRADIAQWAGLDEDDVILECYYNVWGDEYHPDDFEADYDEVQDE